MHHPTHNDEAGARLPPPGSLRRSARPTAAAGSAASAGSSPVIGSLSSIRRPISDESWIEVASQPSSSSLSAAEDEVVTTGLRVTQSINPRRRRRLHRSISEQVHTLRLRPTGPMGSSSQEEYEESESESDRVMTSSNEGIPRTTGFLREEDESHDESGQSAAGCGDSAAMVSDDDGNATALGVVAPSPSIFTPQPTAFSHPPSSSARQTAQTSATDPQGSYFPPLHTPIRESAATSTTITQTTSTRQISSRTQVRARSHTPYTLIAPNHSVPIDHDAALRASLSTLLSCAAAARALPKRDGGLAADATATRSPLAARSSSNRIEPGSLRLIPESALAVRQAGSPSSPHSSSSSSSPAATAPPPLPRRPSASSRSAGGYSSDALPHTSKRKSRSPSARSGGKKRSHTQQQQQHYAVHGGGGGGSYEENSLGSISPTLMTWVLGAGVMVLFSAISFSAGYALGKEVGRMEAGGGGGGGGVGGGLGCARDVDGLLGRGMVGGGGGGGVGGGGGGGMGMKGKGWRWGNASGIRV